MRGVTPASSFFGISTVKVASGQPALPKSYFSGPGFSGALNNSVRSGYKSFMDHMDFHTLGNSSFHQVQFAYGACILWRVLAANDRRKDSPTKSWNEVRENAFRDSLGASFWFFATPILQRGILLYLAKQHAPHLGNALFKVNQDVLQGKGFWGKLKAWNPLYRIDIPSSEQVKNQRDQAIRQLKEAGMKESDAAFQATEKLFGKMLKYRNIATGLGLLNTIALIGICINLLNFYLTNKDMDRRRALLKKPVFPKLPPLTQSPFPTTQSQQLPPSFSSVV